MKKTSLPARVLHIPTLLLIFATVLIVSCNGTFNPKIANAKKTGRRKPNMWVDKGWSNKFEGNFNLQHFQLSQALHGDETDSLFYPVDAFTEMIDTFQNNTRYKFLQAYIVAHDSGTDVKEELKGKLFLLFHPAFNKGQDGPPYYSFDPNGKFYKDPNYQRWFNAYEDKKMSYLKANLDPNDITANQSESGVFSDTRHISYRRKDIDSLISEITYQDTANSAGVTGIRAIFASYSTSGHPYYPKHFKNRIFVIYELTRKDSKNQTDSVFYIDDQPDFPNRQDPEDPNPIALLDTTYMMGVDNGHLCPPNCP